MTVAVLAAPPRCGLPRPWRRALVEALTPLTGTAPILLLGSRAVGGAWSGSDCDLAVVLPLRACLRLAGRLRAAAAHLSEDLGVPVSVSPLPAHRLAHPQGSLYLLKVHRDAVQLAGRPVPLRRDCPVDVTPLAAASYVVSAVVALLEVADADPASERAVHAVRKAALEVAQLRLIDYGRYAATLPAAVDALGDEELAQVASAAGTPEATALVRRLVLREAERRPFSVPRRHVPLRNAQASVLSALRGSPRWGSALRAAALEELLAGLLVTLLASRDPGVIVPVQRRAISLPGDTSWGQLRDEACAAWGRCHVLGGLLR